MSATPIRLLLLEDHPGDALLLRSALAEHAPGEFAITTVEYLADALARIGAEPFDAILCDLGLPDSAGLDTVRAVAASARALPLVVLTGLHDEDLGRKAIGHGAQDYLVKGESSGGLIARTLRYAIERKRLENELQQANATLERRVAERTAELENAVARLTENERKLHAAQAETQQTLALSEQSRLALLSTAEDQLQAAAALRESEARSRAITQSAYEAIITSDSAGNIAGWNRGAGIIFGYTEAQAMGQPMTLLIPPRYRDGYLAGMHRLGSGAEPQLAGKAVELHGVRQDGSEFPLELTLARWESAGGWFVTAIIGDISERKRSEAELNAQMEELRRWQALTLDRADIGMELKREVNALCRRLGEPIRYRSQEESESEEP